MSQLQGLMILYNRGYKRFMYIFIAFWVVCIFLILLSLNYMISLLETDYAINLSICTLIVIASILAYNMLVTIDKEFTLFLNLRSDFDHGIPCSENKFALLSILGKTCNAIVDKQGKLFITSTTEKKSIMALISESVDTTVFYMGFMSATCVSLGLFGTFMGLTKTIASLSVILNGLYKGLDDPSADMLATMVQLIGELQAPLQGMSLAFATSLMGLMGSMVIGFEIIIVSKAISAAIDDLDDWFTQLLDDASKEREEKALLKEQRLIDCMEELNNSVRQASDEQRSLLARIVDLEEQKQAMKIHL